MPWNTYSYPTAMKNLDPAIRDKAIDIANALLAAQIDEGRAIRIAIAKANQWAQREQEHRYL